MRIWVVASDPTDRRRSAVRGQVLEAARALEARGSKPNRKNVEREMERRDVTTYNWYLEQTPSEHARDQFVSRVLRDVRRADRADARARAAEAARAKAVELAGAERMVHFVTNIMRDEEEKRRSRLLKLRISFASLTAALGVALFLCPFFSITPPCPLRPSSGGSESPSGYPAGRWWGSYSRLLRGREVFGGGRVAATGRAILLPPSRFGRRRGVNE